MKLSKSTLALAGCFCLAVLAVPVIAPKTAHALAATLVQITNTATNPVINQDVDSPGRAPYQQQVTCYSANTNQCVAIFPEVPMNKRLVVQYISSSLDTPTPLVNVEFSTGTAIFPILHTMQGNDASGNKIYVASQPMLYTFEAGQRPFVVMNTAAGAFTFVSGGIMLSGHYVDLTQ